MATPLITLTGDGTAPVVSITFDVIDQAYVKATVNGVNAPFTWTGPSQITFSNAAPIGADVRVYRDTPISTPLVDYADPAVLTAADLDLADEQLRHHQEEVDIRVATSADVAAAAVEAADAASEAADSAAASANSATSAGNSATAADTSEAAAAASATTASAAATTATTKAAEALASASSAAIAAATAETAANLPNASIAVQTRVDMALANRNFPAILTEGKRHGVFVWEDGDFTAEVAADTLQGIYVPKNGDPTGAEGAWVRQGVVLTPAMFGGATNYKTGDRTTMTPPYGESQTPGSIDGVLVDATAAVQAVIDMVRFHENTVYVADFSDGLWGISDRGDGIGIEINQPAWLPRTFIGGEFRGIGSGTDLIHVQSAGYSHFEGEWHIRSGADLGSSYGYSSRLWENGLWIRNSAMAVWNQVTVSGFTRYAVELDPEFDLVDYNNNIGLRIRRLYANNNGSAIDRAGNDFSLAFTASSRTGGAGSTAQLTVLTMAAGHEVLRVGDVIRDEAGHYHTIMEKTGADISVYPWILSTAATGTIESAHGGALKITGKDTAGAGVELLSSVSNGHALYLGSQHGSKTGRVIMEGGGLGLIVGVPNGASIGHQIDWLHAEGNTLDLLALEGSQTTLNIDMMASDAATDDAFSQMEVIQANDGTTWGQTVGLPWVTIGLNGVIYASGRNSSTYANGTKSRAFFPILSNDPAINRLRKVQAVGQTTDVTLKYREAHDRLLRDSFVATLEISAPDGTAPGGDITITLDATDAAAGITIDGGAGPYVIPGGSATGPVMVQFWLDTSGATKNWIVVQLAGFAPASSSTLTGEAIQLDNLAGTQRASVFETGSQWYLRMGIPGSVTANGTVNLQGQGVTQELGTFRLYAQTTEVYSLGAQLLNLAAGAVDVTGTVNATVSYKVNGTKVIGAQGAAVADATDAASAITQLNALLARLRTHGLIAT